MRLTLRKLLCLALSGIFFAWSAKAVSFDHQEALQRFEFAQPHMGTTFRIILYAPDKETATRASQAAFERIERLDVTMSDYRETSELMRLCRSAVNRPQRISEDLFRVLEKAQTLARQSDGAFDVTVGPVVRLWRRARRTSELPDAHRLASARALIGYRKLRLNARRRTAKLELPGMLLDLGGIAKGYAADAAVELLKRQGINRALVAAGGDIAVSAPPPGERGWRVSVLPLLPDNNAGRRDLLLRDAAVSTSGDAEQFVEIDGVRYSHIVDPRTGIGLRGRNSVTVVAPQGTTTEGLAKAVSVLGHKRGFALVDAYRGAAAMIVSVDEAGRREMHISKRWQRVPQVTVTIENSGEAMSMKGIR